MIGSNIRKIMIDFNASFDLPTLLLDSSKEHLFNISTATGIPQSFYFTFANVSDYILVFGRFDVYDIEETRKELLSLNQELNNLTRELYRKNAEIKRIEKENIKLSKLQGVLEMAGAASHEISQPLQALMLNIEYLAEEIDTTNKDIYESLQTILENINMLSAISAKKLRR